MNDVREHGLKSRLRLAVVVGQTHSTSVMLRFAYEVEQEPMLLARFHSFHFDEVLQWPVPSKAGSKEAKDRALSRERRQTSENLRGDRPRTGPVKHPARPARLSGMPFL